MGIVPAGCDLESPEYRKFENDYLRAGQKYSVTFGGAPAGTIRLVGPKPKFGSDIVEYDGGAHIRGLVMGLATNAQLSGLTAPLRKLPSAEEQKLSLQFAREKFAERGLPAMLLSRVKIENLTHTP